MFRSSLIDGSRASTAGPSWSESIHGPHDRVPRDRMSDSSSGTLHKTQYTWSQVKLLKGVEAGLPQPGVDVASAERREMAASAMPSAAGCAAQGGQQEADGARSNSMPDLMRRSMTALRAGFMADGNRPTVLYDVARSSAPRKRRQISASLAQLFMRNRMMGSIGATSISEVVRVGGAGNEAKSGTSNEDEEFCSAKSTLSSRSGARAPDIPSDPKPVRELNRKNCNFKSS
jgi:hypothetical protein